ncbi:MAG: class I SAM-dependent rRNA methyltransferase [Clostridia bacterium]|jgi:23S rRNA (cytosine1962-C5)-methyltransferase|nr:class I SAM-dependent rRNA methyltransferase [Clostridia bacterium]
MKIIIKSKYVSKYKKGYPLINEETKSKNGDILTLVDENSKFLARGYAGKQNKGTGWILTLDQEERIDDKFFDKKIKEAVKYRKSFFESEVTNAFRVFNNEGDGIGGMTIDYFDGFVLINWYNKGIIKFRGEILKAIKNNIKYKGIYEKKRFGDSGTYVEEDEFVCGNRASFPIIVKENNVNFAIYFDDGAMVGVFLDQRDVRRKIMERYANNKIALNTFSYTGAFSVFAALGGAKKTVSVDLANRSREKTEEHFALNGVDFNANEIIVEDVFNYFKYAEKKNLMYDLIVLDPPSFARSKKFKFSANKDYKDLLKQIIKITRKNGVIVASTNCALFNMTKFKEFIKLAFEESNKEYEILESETLPRDFKTLKEFKEGNYLKVCFIKVK